MTINDKAIKLWNKFRSDIITPAEFQKLRRHVGETTDTELRILFEKEWEKFETYLPLSEKKKKTLYEKIGIHPTTIKYNFTLRHRWMQTAACLLLLLIGGLTALTLIQRNEINALAEQNVVIHSGDYGQSLVTLPDGSFVHLNAKSSLTYNQDFGRYDRKVTLNGEGFFEVKKNPKKKFTVCTDYMDITVLGTKFNVYAYKTKDIIEMSLVEGCVDITTIHPPHQHIRVKPNEKVTYHKHTGKLLHEKTNNHMETAWMNRELAFRSERLEEVFRCLSRKFAVTFSVDDNTLLNDVYTGTFDDENIESILRVLKCHYGFEYIRKNELIQIRTHK